MITEVNANLALAIRIDFLELTVLLGWNDGEMKPSPY
jgi:hypothetical protein